MQREYSVNDSLHGHFGFKNINILNDSLDEHFDKLYYGVAYAVWSNNSRPVNSLFSDEFIRHSIDYFNSIKERSETVAYGDKYIENLTILPDRFKSVGNIQSSFSVWLNILELLKRIEDATDKSIHKGTAYYFAAGDAIASNDFESGMIMMHLALEEDRSNNDNWENTPANAFMTINPAHVEQFHKTLVEGMASLIHKRLKDDASSYRNSRNMMLDYEIFRTKFLQSTSIIQESARYYFVYSLLRFWHIRKIHKARVTDNVIAPLVFGSVFGSMSLVIETLLAGLVPPPTRVSMAKVIERLGLQIDTAQVQSKLEKDGFESALQDYLSENSIVGDFKIAYICRNQVFHTLNSESSYEKNYIEISQSIFNCIFYAIENHY